MTDFVDFVLAVDAAFAQARLRHAFGGALALAFVAPPRATADIDVNVFIGPDAMARVDAALAPLALERQIDTTTLPIAGVRFSSAVDPFPVDVFPSLDPRYDEIARRVRRHTFGPKGEKLPFLSAEDLCIFKLSFGRPQDWVDLAAIALARPALDVDYIEDQVVGLRGRAMYPRVARLRGLLRKRAE